MDEYSEYCYKYLKYKDPEYLKKIGFDTEEKIIELTTTSNKIEKEQNKNNSQIECPLCKSKNTEIRSQQTRSVDEGESTFILCRNCMKVSRIF